MNPLRVRAKSYRTFDELDLELPEGCVAVVGENGAGKSSIVNVIDLCLFGPESRSLADYLTDDAASTEMELELTFEHANELYRVRRYFSAKGRGQTKLDLERNALRDADDEAGLRADSWLPESAESQKATQEQLERILGLSRETFRASAFLAQGDGAAFTEAKPADRKRILADVLGLDLWAQLLDLARRDRRAIQEKHLEATGRIRLLEETAGDPAQLAAELAGARTAAADAERDQAAAEQALQEAAGIAQTLQAAAAAWTARTSALAAAQARLDAHTRVKAAALEAEQRATIYRGELARLTTLEQTVKLEQREQELVTAIDVYRQQVAEREQAVRARDLAERQRAAVAADAEQRRQKIAETEQRVAHLEQAGPGDERCGLCRQLLGAEALDATLSNLRARIVELADEVRALDEQAAAAVLPALPDEPRRPAIDGVSADDALELVRRSLAQARTDALQRATLDARLTDCQEKLDAATRPEYLETVTRLETEATHARDALDEVEEPEPGALEDAQAAALTARARIDEQRARHDTARAQIVRLEERLAQAEKTAGDLADAKTLRARLQDDLDDRLELERAFGRDGIPALIVEQAAIPQIETEANRILAELGTSYRLELRTEAALKSGDGTRDTLDVIVIGDGGERAYETFSGGERSRINVALRIALARLLAHRRGAESRVLVLDEVEFLDEAGHLRLADVARGLLDDFARVLVVSHAHALRDAFDQAITVTKDGNRSEAVLA